MQNKITKEIGTGKRSNPCKVCCKRYAQTLPELMSCPFCGSKHIHRESVEGSMFLRCQSCSATGGYTFSFEAAGVNINGKLVQSFPYIWETVRKRWNQRIINA